MKRLLLAVAAIALLAAAESRPVDTIFAEGETLDYDLTWLGLTGGSARMTISPFANDATKLHITSIGGSSAGFSRIYRVRDEVESVVGRENFSTLRYHKSLQEGRHSKNETTVIAEGTAARQRNGVHVDNKAVPSPVFDPLSLIYYMRMLDLQSDKEHRFSIYADGKVYSVEANVLRRETVTTPAGTFRTVVVSPLMQAGGIFRDEKGRLTIWYSEDERHLPVRITSDLKIGSISATLRKVTPGVTTIEPQLASDQSK